jgi:hypothetical protein
MAVAECSLIFFVNGYSQFAKILLPYNGLDLGFVKPLGTRVRPRPIADT